ncbi:type I glyceraldehyde-3-phosphate dehydrogenase [Candidatus Dependentiae bacterium]|nr:type I glyceraldehyde-3-phosphate dehydrogenase [Candidatus Dependentiae bacterium]
MIRIAINGFGRIGKTFLRTLLLDERAKNNMQIVAINTGKPASPHLGHLFKFDTTMRALPFNVEQTDKALIVNGISIPLIAELNTENLDWAALNIDWVIECSGKFTTHALATQHIQAGAKHVLISAPAEDADITVIPGINHEFFNKKLHKIVSLGSCTTNCFAPIIKVLHDHFNIIHGMMTTIHAYTNDQVVLDIDHKDPRRARTAAQNIIPSKTGAEQTIIKIYPELAGKLKAHAMRVPVMDASIVDFTVATKENTSTEELNILFRKAAQEHLRDTIEYIEQPLVSSDIIGNPHAAIVDGLLTQSLGTISRICAWYDNEFGYASRMKEFLLHL